MKEITRIITMKVTMIEKAEDDKVDSIIASANTEENRRLYADILKATLEADHVEVTGIKDFVMDIRE